MCAICKYMNAKRRNLYQHLKKKHKISIVVKKDGTASCVVEPNADVTVVASTEGKNVSKTAHLYSCSFLSKAVSVCAGQEVTEVVSVNADAAGAQPNKVVNIVDLANSLTQKHEINNLIQKGTNWCHIPCSFAPSVCPIHRRYVLEQ